VEGPRHIAQESVPRPVAAPDATSQLTVQSRAADPEGTFPVLQGDAGPIHREAFLGPQALPIVRRPREKPRPGGHHQASLPIHAEVARRCHEAARRGHGTESLMDIGLQHPESLGRADPDPPLAIPDHRIHAFLAQAWKVPGTPRVAFQGKHLGHPSGAATQDSRPEASAGLHRERGGLAGGPSGGRQEPGARLVDEQSTAQAHPEASIRGAGQGFHLFLRKTGFGRNGLETVGAPSGQAGIGSGPENAGRGFMQGPHIGGREPLAAVETLEVAPVVSVEAVLGSGPEIAFAILHQGKHRQVAQALFHPIGAEGCPAAGVNRSRNADAGQADEKQQEESQEQAHGNPGGCLRLSDAKGGLNAGKAKEKACRT